MRKLDGLLVTLKDPEHFGILKVKDVQVEDSLEGIYKAMNVDCIEVPVIGNGWQMILDEEGKINGKWKPTMTAEMFGLRDILFGPILFLGLTEDGENASLAKEQKEEIMGLLNASKNTSWTFIYSKSKK